MLTPTFGLSMRFLFSRLIVFQIVRLSLTLTCFLRGEICFQKTVLATETFSVWRMLGLERSLVC